MDKGCDVLVSDVGVNVPFVPVEVPVGGLDVLASDEM